MFTDIVNFKVDNLAKELGFSRVYNLKDLNVIRGGNLVKNREIVKNKKVDILLNTGNNFNQVLCKLAKENKIAIGFSFSEILNSKNRVSSLRNVIKNVKLCRKYKVKMDFASFAKNRFELRNVYDLMAFAQVLGMTAKESKESLSFKKKR